MAEAGLKKIVCLVGTRPEGIKMAPVIRALKRQPWATTVVVSTGQHREMIRQTLGIFDIGIDIDLDVMEANQTLAGLSARIFQRLDPLLVDLAPDLVLVQGDTTSVMVAALNCFYRRVPVGHVEAGLRTHDLANPFPEEMNRLIAGHASAIHFAPTEASYNNLIGERHDAATVHVTGNTVIDALLDVAGRDLPCDFPRPGRRLVLITAHRRENFGAPLVNICRAIQSLHDRFEDVDFVYPVHPNPNIRGPVFEHLSGLERLHLTEPVNYLDLTALMKASTFVLTDSGGIQEEAPALGKPVLVLRAETERPEAVNAGVARLAGTETQAIVEECSRLLTDPAAYAAMARGISPYGDGKAAGRIVSLCRTFLKVV
ncbi:MAG TPA: UDP-N-acetylglucosamine 2-epimerase (non-hydrolyzing) [Beijerinckiaceae bacterium]|nr:UDP-N-acetylglucosamine 2-epimerase (non-hydrolyzing) [Beijerinckiaceae bacterium]